MRRVATRTTRRAFARTLALIVMAVTLTGIEETAQANQVQVGVATEQLALPKGVPLAGYSRRKGKPSLGLNDPIQVRALLVQDAETTAALVSCDLLIIDERLFAAVRNRLTRRGLSSSIVLLLAATHTHSGPGAYGTTFLEKLSMGHFDATVFETIVETIARTVERAHRDLAPARMAYHSTVVEEVSTNRVDPQGLVDPDLAVVAFYRDDHPGPLAVLVNYAAHPTTLGAENRYLSADYPGVVALAVNQRFPEATCLFFAGSVGDQAPVKRGEGVDALTQMRWIGERLAEHVIALLEPQREETPQHPGVQAIQEDLPLPAAQVRLGPQRRLPGWIGRRLVDDDATLTVVTVGDVLFAGVPCDLFAVLGQRVKQAAIARGYHPVIVGFADDYIGYCVPESLYATDEYEAMMAFNGPKAGELIVERLVQMIHSVSDK